MGAERRSDSRRKGVRVISKLDRTSGNIEHAGAHKILGRDEISRRVPKHTWLVGWKSAIHLFTASICFPIGASAVYWAVLEIDYALDVVGVAIPLDVGVAVVDCGFFDSVSSSNVTCV